MTVLALAGSLALACVSEHGTRHRDLSAYLPGEEVAGWAKDGPAEVYEGDALYTYIDGGAEIYHEYGFRRVILQDYQDEQERSVSMEIFEMETPAAAYGMFTFKRSGKGKHLSVGDEAELESYYLNLRKGRFLATLTGFDEETQTVEGLVTLGKAVDVRIPAAGKKPDLAGSLPGPGLQPGSVKYFRGRLGLNSIYPFPTARGLDFEEGVGGTYESGATLIILEYAAIDRATGSRPPLAESLVTSAGYSAVDIPGDPGTRCFLDPKGRTVCLAGSGARVVVAFGPERAACLELIGRAE